MYKTAHGAALNGTQLSAADERILVLGCSTEAGKDSLTAAGLSGRSGQTVTGQKRDTLDAIVRFGIRCRRSGMNERGEIFEKAMKWARAAMEAGAWLTFDQKPGRRLRVRLAALPAEGDPWEWNKEYAITFRACEIPFWQDDTATSATASGAEISAQMAVPGSARTVAALTFENTSGATCDTLDIDTGAGEMHFTGLGLLDGERLVIDHNSDAVLRIRIRNAGGSYRSVMAKRVAATSDDELWILPGTRTVTGTAGQAGTWTISCFGRYL